MKYIKDNQIRDDEWVLVTKPEDASDMGDTDDVMVSYKYWAGNRDDLSNRSGRLAIYIEGDDPLEDIESELTRFDLIGLFFPVFKDGRSYSHARILRDRYGYTGELRAVGEVLRDQLFYMKRCGIDAYGLDESSDYDTALKSLNDFTIVYQGASDQMTPIPNLRRESS